MERLSLDVIMYMAMNMDVPEILTLCETSKRFNRFICKNQKFWMNRIIMEFPYLDIREYGPDYYTSYRNLAYRDIEIYVGLAMLDEETTDWEGPEEDWEEDEVYANSIVRLRTNLPEEAVSEILYNIADNLGDSVDYGYFTVRINGEDTICNNVQELDIECFNDANNHIESVNIFLLSLGPGDVEYYEDNLDDILETAISKAKANYYGQI